MNNKGKRLNRVILRGDVYWNWENENGIIRPIPKIIDDNNAPVVRTTTVDIVFNDEIINTYTYNQHDVIPNVGELLPLGYVYIDPKYRIQKYVHNKFVVVYDYYDVIIHYLDGSNPGNTIQFGEFRQRYKYGTVVNKDMIKWPEGKRLDTEWFDFVVGYRTSARIINKYMYFSNTVNDTSYPWGTAPTNLTAPTTIEYTDENFPTIKNVITTPFPLFGDLNYTSYFPLVRSNMESYRNIVTEWLRSRDGNWGEYRYNHPDDQIDFRGRVSTYMWTANDNIRTIKKFDDHLYESKHTSINKECVIDGVRYWPFSLFLGVGYYDKIPFTDGGVATNKMYADIEYDDWLAQNGKEYIEDYIQRFFAVYPNDIEKRPTSMSEKDFLEYYHNNIDMLVHSIKDKYGNDTVSTIVNTSEDYLTETILDLNIKKYINRHEYNKDSWLYRQYIRIEPFSPFGRHNNTMDITINGVTKKLSITICYLTPTVYACALLEKNGKIYKFFYQLLTRYEGDLSLNDFVSIFPNNASDGTPLKNDTTIVRVKKLKTTPQADISWTDISKMESTTIRREDQLTLYNAKDAHEQNPNEVICDPNKIPGVWADISQKELLSKTKTHIDTYIIETRTTGAEAGPSVNLTRYKVYYTDENGNRKDLETDLYLMSGESVINALDYPKRYQLKSGFTPVVEPYDSKNGWYPVRVEIERTLNSAVIKLALGNPDGHTHEDWNRFVNRTTPVEVQTPIKVKDGSVMTIETIKNHVLSSTSNREWFTKSEEVQPIGLFHTDGTPVSEDEKIYDDVEYVLKFKLIKSDIIYHEISLLDRVKKYMWLNGNAADLDFCLAAFWVKADNVYGPTEYEFKNGKRIRNDIFEPFTPTSPAKNSMYYAINDNYEMAKGASVSFEIIRNNIVIHTVEDYPLEKLFGTNALKNPIRLPNSTPAYSEYMINNLYYILTANMTDIDLKEAYLKAGINFYGLSDIPTEDGDGGGVGEPVFSTGYIPKNEMDIKVRLGWTGELLSKGITVNNIPYKLVIDFIPTMLLPYVSGDDFKEPDDKCKLMIKNFIYVPGRYKTWEESEPHNTGKNIILRLLTDNELTDDGSLALFYKNPNNLNYGVGSIREMNYMLTSTVSGGTRGFFTRMHQARFMCYTLIPMICTLRHFGTFGPVLKTLGVSYLDKNAKPHDYWLTNNERYRQTIGFNENIQWENNGLVYTAYTDQSDYTFLSETILKVGDEIFKNAWRRWNFPTYGVTSKDDWYRVMKKFLGTTIDEAAIGYDIYSFPYRHLGTNHTWEMIESLAYREGDNNPFSNTNLQFGSGDRDVYVNTEDFASATPTNTNATMNGWRINTQKIPRTFVQHIRSNAVHNAQYITKAYFIPSGTKWDKRYNPNTHSNGSGASLIAYNQRNPMYRIIDNITSFNDLTKRVFWRHVFASVYNAYMSQITTGTEAGNSSFYTMTRYISMNVYSYDNVNYKKYALMAGAVMNARFVCMMNPDTNNIIQSSDLITVYIPKGLNSRYMGYVEK